MYYKASFSTKCYIPLVLSPVCAGFPSPATDYIDKKIDLNEYIVKHPEATFYVKCQGDSMLGAGIHPGDILVVDRSLIAANGNIVVAVVNGEFTVKKLIMRGKNIFLAAENQNYSDLLITECMEFEIWGVVTTVIHSV
ncbi:translesion error-prone DNA polymerase V autoproteolytic subunit [Pigmentibacter sp. JX0631]|uniref:LexA family protein n=1 Tax=Pigmentibacter sp. JX0631 TaxID=2976982 RepID=UPI002468FFC2|nr:translesion error-prone DNA polymerase V autoproteolytic subunit [Pigmentibacter sp. JX0631]WGL60617.1 translesion error-prone DNA polymerase V autoproteolytic subunit [Pigmentibacter sp. JX0631]